ncbi:MAG TPA: S9 family peptidase [Acidobacteriota bacterium]|nr:S9 family peptidase [Acidobacteriota bacterium]
MALERMKDWRRLASAALTVALVFGFGWVVGQEAEDEAQEKVPEFEDILNLKAPSSVVISPDGSKVAFVVREPDWEENSYVSQIWMAASPDDEPRQMTFGEKSSSSPQFSPDGQWLSFLSAREEKSQVYLLPLAGGEARQVTEAKEGVQSYEWAPDSQSIAFLARDEQSEASKEREEKYGKFTVVDEDFEISHLWIQGIEDGEARKLVGDEDKHIAGMAFSPDGSSIAFSAAPDSRIKSFSKTDLFVVEVEGGEISILVDQEGPDSNPVFSPDGTRVAFNTSMGTEVYFVNTEIAAIPVQGGPIVNLTGSFDEDARLLDWSSRGIHFTAYQGMSRHLFRLSPESGAVRNLTPGDQVIQSIDLNPDASRMAFSLVSAESYPEVFISPVDDYEASLLTGFNEQLDGWKLAHKETIAWESRDGTEITGVLIKPEDFDSSKRYPLFVIIHGGPTGISYPQRVDRYNGIYPIEQWVSRGALVLLPNYRGSAGFGADFRKLNYRNLGVGDYWDVLSGVDHLIAQGLADRDRVAAMGWSQGGYISAFITTFSDRFAATSVGAGISDWVTYYYQTDITPFTLHYLGDDPWDDPEVYRKTSPMTHIKKARTPTLIQHGEFDRRVPTPNAYKLYRGLQDQGVPSKLIIYKGFGHGISKPKERLAALTHNWEWFEQWIWNQESADTSDGR